MTGPLGILVAAHDLGPMLDECLASLVAQTDPEWRCVVVDDASRDDTADRARAWAAREPRIEAIALERNVGQSAARNVGAQVLLRTCGWIWPLDGDDLLVPTALAEMRAAVAERPEAVAIGCQYDALLPDGRRVPARRSRYVPARPLPRDLRDDEELTPAVTFFCVTGNGPFYLLRGDRWSGRWGTGYDERLRAHEDADLLLRYALAGPVHVLPQRLYVKRERAGSMTTVGQESGSERVFLDTWRSRALEPDADPRLRAMARYHDSVHVPLRDLRVALIAVRRRRLRHAVTLVAHALWAVLGLSWWRTRRRHRPSTSGGGRG